VLATVYISANSQTERSDDHSDHATAPDANEPSRA